MAIKNHKDYSKENLKEKYSKIQTIININSLYSWMIGGRSIISYEIIF